MNDLQQILPIAKQFTGFGEISDITPVKHGLVNQTYVIESPEHKKAILQCINKEVFPRPKEIMANLHVLLEHLDGNPIYHECEWRLPQIVSTQSGEVSCHYQGETWRALEFIEPSRVVTKVESIEQVVSAGKALGQFHRCTKSLDGDRLTDTLPGFHCTSDYWQALIDHQKYLRDPAVPKQLWSFIGRQADIVQEIELAKTSGELHQQVTHGDPKLANFLFHSRQDHVVGIIDLDTVKPGIVLYDLADCLRSCCNVAPKNQPGELDLNLAAPLLKAYAAEYREFLSDSENRLVLPAIKILPLELAVRYLYDHLNGDHYFSTSFPGQNLQRAQHYFGLLESLYKQELKLKRIIENSFQ